VSLLQLSFSSFFFPPSFFGGNFCSKATGKFDSAFGVGDREEEEEEEQEEEEEEEVLNVVVLFFTGGKIWPLGLDDRLLLRTLLFHLLLPLDLLLFLLLLWESFSFWLSVFFCGFRNPPMLQNLWSEHGFECSENDHYAGLCPIYCSNLVLLSSLADSILPVQYF
jgi:hypothetical protein